MYETIYDCWLYYGKVLADFWRNLGPRGYGTLLTSVGVIGWIMMKGSKR